MALYQWSRASGSANRPNCFGQYRGGNAPQMSHIGKILERAGCSFDDVVKCTCHLVKIEDFDRFDAVYAEFFPGVKPARTTVQSVLGGGIKVEIDAIARVPLSK